MATITGTANSNDTLQGTLGNDILDGLGAALTQEDILRGGDGDDTYIVKSHYKKTWIEDTSGTADTVSFDPTLMFSGLAIDMNGHDLLVTSSASGASDFELTLRFHMTTQPVENFTFSDGSTYTLNGTEITADSNDNVIHAAIGNYSLHGGDGNDTIYASSIFMPQMNQTYLHGDDGNDTLIGGDKLDFLYGDNGNDIIYGYSDDDELYGGDGDDIIYGGDGDDKIHGGAGCDILYTGNGDKNDLWGNDGADKLIVNVNTEGGGSHNSLRGEAGNDLYVFDNINTSAVLAETSTSIVFENTINLGSGNHDTIKFGTGISFSDLTFEHNFGSLHITTSSGVSVEIADQEINVNVERLTFADSNDIYILGTGASATKLVASNVGETHYLTADDDVFDALGGDDTVYALAGDDRLLGNSGVDHFDGGKGSDTVDYSNAAAGINANLGAQKVGIDGDGSNDTLASIENITGSTFRDVIYGSGISNIIRGGGGNDYINSLGGGDFLYGEDGNDTIYGGADTDFIDGGDGDDLIITYAGDDDVFGGNGRDLIFTSADAQIDSGSNLKDEVRFHTTETVNSVTVNLADGTLYSEDTNGTVINTGSITGVEYVRGTQQGDTITGDANDNLIVGYGGDDTLNGGGGQDYIEGNDGDDVIHGGDGDDKSVWVNGVKTVNAGLYGGDGNDTINGGSGEDWLFGGNGNDTLESSGDRDHLYGEDGADTFIFKDIAYTDTTLIHDFDLTEGDTIDVSDVLSGFDPIADDINDYLTLAEAAGHTYVWADQNGTDTGGNILLARLTGVTGLDVDTMYLNGDIII